MLSCGLCNIRVGMARINMLTTEQILERISKNIKKGSERNKRNYYRLGRRIEKLNEIVKIHPEQKVSARLTRETGMARHLGNLEK